MIGVVVPAHNEENYLEACLSALQLAAIHPKLKEKVSIVIVLDACTDFSEAIVLRQIKQSCENCKISYISINECNVGKARALGAKLMLKQNVRWLAFTDADTQVSSEWLVAQLALNVDVVCGSVAVNDWSSRGEYAAFLQNDFEKTYNDNDGHRHIHGANLGVAADFYIKAGGFPALPCHEDVALVNALQNINARFAWSAAPRVFTSARSNPRARGGFGDTLSAKLNLASA